MNEILYVGYKNGQRVMEKIRFKPEIYMPTNQASNWIGLDGTRIEPKQFSTMSECTRFLKEKE